MLSTCASAIAYKHVIYSSSFYQTSVYYSEMFQNDTDTNAMPMR